MKRVLVISFLITVCSPFALAQGTQDEEAVIKLQNEFGAAWVKNDAAALDRLLSNDFTITNPLGEVISKADLLSGVKSGVFKLESVNFDDTKVRVYGNVAVATSRATSKGTIGGQSANGQYRILAVSVKGPSGWQSLAIQATQIRQ